MSRARGVGVGMPGWLKLNEFGAVLRDAFPGEIPFLVGTAAESKKWRDVDVRIMLDVEAWESLVGKGEVMHRGPYYSGRPAAFALAFSALGTQMTDLPIDFQIQELEHANVHYGDRPRVALGVSLQCRI